MSSAVMLGAFCFNKYKKIEYCFFICFIFIIFVFLK